VTIRVVLRLALGVEILCVLVVVVGAQTGEQVLLEEHARLMQRLRGTATVREQWLVALCVQRAVQLEAALSRIEAALLPPAKGEAVVILSSRENPKICGIDDAEVVGDLVAVDMPVPRHLLAQKS